RNCPGGVPVTPFACEYFHELTQCQGRNPEKVSAVSKLTAFLPDLSWWAAPRVGQPTVNVVRSRPHCRHFRRVLQGTQELCVVIPIKLCVIIAVSRQLATHAAQT